MQVSSVNSAAFRAAKVDSPSPLVSGDWKFVTDKTTQTPEQPKEESHWFRKTLYWIAGIAIATAALVGIRNTKAIKNVMDAGSFSAQKGLGKKFLYGVGKLGDYANWLKSKTWDKVAKLFKKAKTDAPTPSTAPTPTLTPKPTLTADAPKPAAPTSKPQTGKKPAASKPSSKPASDTPKADSKKPTAASKPKNTQQSKKPVKKDSETVQTTSKKPVKKGSVDTENTGKKNVNNFDGTQPKSKKISK